MRFEFKLTQDLIWIERLTVKCCVEKRTTLLCIIIYRQRLSIDLEMLDLLAVDEADCVKRAHSSLLYVTTRLVCLLDQNTKVGVCLEKI